MLSRRSFLGASYVMLATAARRGQAQTPPEPVIDVDFCNRSQTGDHMGLFGAPSRYVNHEVFGDPAGAIFEEASVNGVEDAGYSEASSLPMGWQIIARSGTASGTQSTFTKTDTARARINVTGESADEIAIVMGSDRHFLIKQGDQLTGSVAVCIAHDDSKSLASLGMFIVERNEGGDAADSNPTATPIQQIQTDKAWWAQVQHVALGDGFATLVLRIVTKNKFNITLEINYAQLEKRAWRSTFCVGSRQSDATTLVAASSYLSKQERSVVIVADAPRFATEATLWTEYGDADNHIGIEFRDRVLFARVVVGGIATELRLGVVPPLMRFRVCVVFKINGFAASLNGKPAQNAECRMPDSLHQANLGSGNKGTWNSTVARLMLFGARVADVAAASRQEKTFYDDFDRPDSGSLGMSPTGQAIQRFGANTRIDGRKWVADSELSLVSAAYGTIRMSHVPRYIGAVMNWTTGLTEGGAGLIASTHENLDVPLNALHTVLTDRREIFQTITHSSVDKEFASFFYPTPMRRDGATSYGVAAMLNAIDSAVVYVGPQGDLVRHVDPTYVQRAGPVVVFEHYWHLSQCRPEFLAVAAF
jgi:hypothetical protein